MIFSNHLFKIFILIVFIIKCKCKLTKEDVSYEDFSVTTDKYEKEKEKEIVKNVTDLVELDIIQEENNTFTTSDEGLSVLNLEDDIKASTTTQSSKDSSVLITNLTVSQLNEKRTERKEGDANDDQSLFKSEKRRKPNHSPSVDDIISGIIQLIGGNVKLGRPSQKHQAQQPPSQHGQASGRPLIIPYPTNPTRINNRGPPQIGFAGSLSPNQPHNLLPPSVLIGHDLPAGLPIPLPPSFHHQSSSSLEIVTNRPLYNSLLTGHSFSIIDDNQLQDRLSNSQKQMTSSNFMTTVGSSLNTLTFSSEKTHSSIPSPIFLKSASNEAESVIEKKTRKATITATITKAESDKETILSSIYSSKLDPSLISPTETSSFSSFKSEEASFEASTSEVSIPSGPITAWVPFFSQSSASSKKVWTEEPPSIITKPEMPSTFDVTVKHKLGPSLASDQSSLTSHTSLTAEVSKILSSSSSTTTTSSGLKSSSLRLEIKPTATIQSSHISRTFYSDPDIVYGRPDTIKNDHISKMISPSFHTTGHIKLHRDSSTMTMKSSSTTVFGRPVVIPLDVEQVKPHLGAELTPSVITEPGKGSVYIEGRQTRFKIRPNIKTEPTLHVGSGVRINTVNDNHNVNTKSSALIKNQGARPSIMRRPGFRPRPSTPLVRIDTCIVGDDSTCGSNLNEHCKTEIGISSCQCKPGFGRIAPRSMCIPIVTLSILFRVDRLGENKLIFSSKLQNSETEEYQYLEYESLQALNSLFNSSRLGKIFKGAKVNKFALFGGKTMVNATIELDKTNATRSVSIKRIVQQEISRLIASRNNNIGDSQLWADGSISTVPRVDDINECSNTELNDCSKFATCFNEFGTFRCVCKAGYEDKFSQNNLKAGRYCASCSPTYCSNRGECLIIDGEKECKCRGNFIGSKCDIDGEVLGVALGGSIAALIIIIITFLCLYMWNQRWKNDLQKMEAMSAGSGQTFICVNKQQPANYRCSLDDRNRWATVAHTLPVNANYNYYVNPEHLMAASQQHVYSTPCRVQTPDALLNDDSCTIESRTHARSLRPKSRASLGPSYQQAYGPGSVYNETEFSTRETIYAPSHLFISPRSKYSIYN